MAEQKARAAWCAGPAPTVCLRMCPVRGPAPAVLLEAREEHPDGLGVEVWRCGGVQGCSASRPEVQP